jgi:hypothetical protein
MPKRFDPMVRARYYSYLVQRDGENCALCSKTPLQIVRGRLFFEAGGQQSVRGGRISILEIDHIDGNPKNNALSNLRLLCHRCNARAYQLQCVREGGEMNHGDVIDADSKKGTLGLTMTIYNKLIERERKEGNDSTRIVKQLACYEQGDPTMKANALFEVPFREWVLEQVNMRGFLSMNDAKYGGAENVKCSPKVAEEYIKKLASITGPLNKVKDELGQAILIFKPHLQFISTNNKAKAHSHPSKTGVNQ